MNRVDEFFAMILALIMIAIELMTIIVGVPIMASFPILMVIDGRILFAPFVTAVCAVMILYTINLWFAQGFITVIANIRVGRKLKKQYENIEEVHTE